MMQVVCATYLTGQADPQRGFRRRPDRFTYMRAWYESMRDLNLCGIVFHDELSPAFVARHQTDRLRFRRVTRSRWSINDQRFFEYYRYLSRRPFAYAFLTDISDVRIVQDPFAPMIRRGWPLVIGAEVYPPPIGRTIGKHPWMMDRIQDTRTARSSSVLDFFQRRQFNLPTLNAGVIGGRRREIVRFLRAFVRLRRTIGEPARNLNMPIVNYLFHRLFEGRFRAGPPVTSRFKRYEHQRRNVWFIHK